MIFKRGEILVLEQSSLLWITTIRTYTRIKILNEAGREAANVSLEASKDVRFSKIEGRTILPSGKIVPLDSSQVFRGAAYEAGKRFAIMKTSFTFPAVEPGAIVEYQTEERVDWYFFPPWIFDTRGLATLRSSLKVVVAPRLSLAQFPLETTISKIKATEVRTAMGQQYDYEVQNLYPIRDEPYAVPFRDQAAMVIFTPYELAFSNQVFPIIQKWDDIAKVMSQELEQANKKNKETKDKAKELSATGSDDRQRAQAIYKYIQQSVASTNLTGVNVGRSVDEVLHSKQGDPDEINALFFTMLREAKVDADLVLIAGKNWQSLVTKFPNLSQFSRVVTRLNFKGGVVFADPADAAAPFGELPWFERGLVGLAVKGSKVQEAIIPEAAADDNLFTATVSAQLSSDWKVVSAEEVNFKGSEALDFRRGLLEQAPERMKQDLDDYFVSGLAGAGVSDLVHGDLRDTSQPLLFKAVVKHELDEEAGPGERLLDPWTIDQYRSPLFKASERHSAVLFDYPERRRSTSTWRLPLDISVAQLPKEVQIDNDLGGFSHSCTQQADVITCTRSFILKKTTLRDLREYASAKKFFEEVAKYDREVIVLKEH